MLLIPAYLHDMGETQVEAFGAEYSNSLVRQDQRPTKPLYMLKTQNR